MKVLPLQNFTFGLHLVNTFRLGPSIKVQLCAGFSYASIGFWRKCDQSHSRQLYVEFTCEFIFTQRDNRRKVAKVPLSSFMNFNFSKICIFML